MPKSKVYSISDEEFTVIIQESNSYAECARKIGLSDKGANASNQIKKRIKELNLSTKHFNSIIGMHIKNTYALDDILVENSSYANISRLKERLIRENRLEYKCAICGNSGEWLGNKLTL